MPEELSLEEVLANSAPLPDSANEVEKEVANTEEENKLEENKIEEKQEEKVEEKVEETQEEPAKKPDLWDGVEISEEDKAFWNKKASVEARQKVASILRERKELKAPPATSYYDNEKAYLLDPAFRDAINEVESAEWLENHWTNQLALAEDGEDIQGIRPVLNAKGEFTGRYEPGDKIKFDSRIKGAVQKELYKALSAKNSAENKTNEIRSSYTKHAGAIKTKIETARKETFAHWQDPKNSEARKIVENHVRQTLGADNGNPLFPILVDAVAELFHQLQASKAGKSAPKPEPKPKSEGLTKTRDSKEIADKWAQAIAEGDDSILKG